MAHPSLRATGRCWKAERSSSRSLPWRRSASDPSSPSGDRRDCSVSNNDSPERAFSGPGPSLSPFTSIYERHAPAAATRSAKKEYDADGKVAATALWLDIPLVAHDGIFRDAPGLALVEPTRPAAIGGAALRIVAAGASQRRRPLSRWPAPVEPRGQVAARSQPRAVSCSRAISRIAWDARSPDLPSGLLGPARGKLIGESELRLGGSVHLRSTVAVLVTSAGLLGVGSGMTAAQADAGSVPLKGRFSSTCDGSSTCLTFAGNLTHLGKFEGQITSVTSCPPADGCTTATWTAANGDTVDVSSMFTVTGFDSSTGLFTFVQQIKVTGGTGRFTGASGSAVGSGKTAADFSTYYGSISGAIDPQTGRR